MNEENKKDKFVRDRFIGCKTISPMKIMILIGKEAPANLVPAAAVRRGGRALFGMIGLKGFVDGFCCFMLKIKFIF